MAMSKIIERVSQIIEDKGISNRAFEISIGASNGMIGRAISKGTDITSEWLSKILGNYPDINAEWLLTGSGERYRAKAPGAHYAGERPVSVVRDVGMKYTAEPAPSYRSLAGRRITVYNMETIPGLEALFAGDYEQQLVEMIDTDVIPPCDGGLRMFGDVMYPLLRSGDVVFYKKIYEVRGNIVWGEMYLLSFDMEGEEYITVKYLQRSELKDHVSLVSCDRQQGSMDIHISRIRALAFVKASLRLNSIK